MSGDKTVHGSTARALIRAADRATLATALPSSEALDAAMDGPGGGWPYASLVMVACDHDASPLLYSLFLETEIGFGGEGGIYAELLRNRDFEARIATALVTAGEAE